MKLWIICRKTRQFGAPETGKHLRKPTLAEICEAIHECDVKGFQTLYVYDTQRTALKLAETLTTLWPDQIIGWNDFMQTQDGFVLDTEKTWSNRASGDGAFRTNDQWG